MDTGKRAAGERAAELVEDGMQVGLGTGSTAYWAVHRLGERVRQGLRIRGVPTSKRTEAQAKEVGIPLTTLADVEALDLTIDGADEIDDALHLIKGGGGALLREKLVAAASRRLVIVADDSKRVEQLGAFPLPVAVVPFAWEVTARRIESLGCDPRLRRGDGGEPYVSDDGLYILDCPFGAIADPPALEQALKRLPGVVESGLFTKMADLAFVGGRDGAVERFEGRGG